MQVAQSGRYKGHHCVLHHYRLICFIAVNIVSIIMVCSGSQNGPTSLPTLSLFAPDPACLLPTVVEEVIQLTLFKKYNRKYVSKIGKYKLHPQTSTHGSLHHSNYYKVQNIYYFLAVAVLKSGGTAAPSAPLPPLPLSLHAFVAIRIDLL